MRKDCVSKTKIHSYILSILPSKLIDSLPEDDEIPYMQLKAAARLLSDDIVKTIEVFYDLPISLEHTTCCKIDDDKYYSYIKFHSTILDKLMPQGSINDDIDKIMEIIFKGTTNKIILEIE